MLRLDRYLAMHRRTLDLASGRLVDLERSKAAHGGVRLFQSRAGRTLIDCEVDGDHRVDVWEEWIAGSQPCGAERVLVDFVELLESARLGAPRGFDLPARSARHDAYLRRLLAREARTRGWVPVAIPVLVALPGARRHRFPPWLADRSLVVFADVPGLPKDASVALLRLARRDARPHVLVRTLVGRTGRLPYPFESQEGAPLVHERRETFGASETPLDPDPRDARTEASARWQWLLDRMVASRASPQRALQLANVLVARDQAFEARALLEPLITPASPWAERATTVLSAINALGSARTSRGWEMVDDFVDVLQLCQDIEDEQAALARVGAFLRERLQASSVAFVVRDGRAPRVITRVGSTAAGVDLALRTMETGVPVAPARAEGPVESACPVRHAAEVIGALWCRWSAGMPVAPHQASTLLGIAAAAAAPSVRLALAKAAPVVRSNPVPELVGESGAMHSVRDAIVRASASPFAVIIEGESGSGKELAARAIHARSPRRDRRFCAINCAALVDDLVEAELFGHARGAFTGAHTERPGLFEDASGGTLFMDEIADLGARVQAKLLRVLQEGEIRRVGETLVRKVDVRIVAATNRPLAGEVASGAFRADLWYRLDVIRITLPPLRERIEDVPLLAQHLWRGLAGRTGSRAMLSPAAIAALAAYDWPGNIRELQNVLASILVSAPPSGLIGPASLPVHVARVAAIDTRLSTLADARRQFEERYVRAALARSAGRTAAAAKDLGLSRQGLVKLMGRLGIAESPRRSI
ncbi:MAG TPA: sigma 54-interacting transcriptional regulator [Vicinamibacterales bacterium]|nr:sigma 54-interacting transcriptional regulator [Vicinamibacterales bacterium]